MTGLWVDKVEPDINLFLKPFVDEENDLSNKGLKWKLGEETITSKFIPLCACFDSVARCKVLNMKQYNESVPIKKTDESINNQMLLASTKE
ncbi:hypothetical protein KQX54_012473 [Cotesia glomerata]|uniref:Uncharacterized protein n=1 Tax=Cotesia glomerata TaxID=32391 RepID=A0AAV7I8X4_COTGL|nr:hypothetical protein KQX54_012473 [Cotesia glomerata]